jgi:hypothetical protein
VSHSYAVLVARIRAELSELERVEARVARALNAARADVDAQDLYLDSVALNLHDVYSGLERLFRLVVETIDGDLPVGHDWHRALLQQVTMEIPDLRPLLVSRETADALAEYLGFRHVVRNVYAFRFDPARLERLAGRVPDVMAMCRADLERFLAFLDALG